MQWRCIWGTTELSTAPFRLSGTWLAGFHTFAVALTQLEDPHYFAPGATDNWSECVIEMTLVLQQERQTQRQFTRLGISVSAQAQICSSRAKCELLHR